MRVYTGAACHSRRKSLATLTAGIVLLLAGAPACLAGGGPFGIDHEWNYDDSGIWKRSYQEALEYGLLGGEVIGAVWEGGETRFGRTLWQSIDASAFS
ncbi:MAG TPA: hypothetical protein VGP32_06540, partial [Steroidobacteraceae bacterium]|nr:hypothetical protein [Steroidobacteraceae bacterium]